MQITEPVTMLTDYAMGAASLFFGRVLWRHIGPRNRTTVHLWVIGFAMCSIGFAGGCMVSGSIVSDVRTHKEGRQWLTAGILVTFAGIAVQQTGFRHGAGFNHNDVYHLIQIAALYLFFRCARVVEDRR